MIDYPTYIEDAKTFSKIEPYQNDIVCKEVAEWSDDWFKSILPENNKLSLSFDAWDSEFKGKLRGKLVPIIGYGGTKKSLLALNIAYDNIIRGLGKCIYSSMEMGATEIINRLIDLHIPAESIFNPHSELEYHHNKTGRIDAKEFYNNSFAPFFKGNFFITENTSLQTDSYDRLLTKFKEQAISVDILIVDGLAGMGGTGSETELYSKHSKELKDLANKWKLLILLICHVSKGGKKTDRDLSDKVRSSEKIIDNSDMYITNSLFEQGSEYNKEYGNCRLVNKRGTGNIIDVVYYFDHLRLSMLQSEKKITDFDNGGNGL